MTTITTRTVNLSVNAPTLDDVIRVTIEPVTSFTQDDAAETTSISFTVPSTAQVGDTVKLFLSWRLYRYCVEFLYSSTQLSYIDNFSRIGAATWADDAAIPGYGLARFEIYELAAEDIGATFTITLHDCETGTHYSTSAFSPILYGVVLNGAYYDAEYSRGYQEVAENTGARDELVPLTSSVNHQLFFYCRTMFPTGDSNAPFLATELCDTTANDNSLFVAARVVKNSGTVVDYAVDANPNITMLSALIKG